MGSEVCCGHGHFHFQVTGQYDRDLGAERRARTIPAAPAVVGVPGDRHSLPSDQCSRHGPEYFLLVLCQFVSGHSFLLASDGSGGPLIQLGCCFSCCTALAHFFSLPTRSSAASASAALAVPINSRLPSRKTSCIPKLPEIL